MTNTIPNVPRELLENIVLCYNEGEFELGTLAAECHALLSAPSPAGVDGLKVVGYIQRGGIDGAEWEVGGAPESVPVTPIADAQAIIDGLRGENKALHAQVKVLQSDANSWQSGYDEGRRMGGKHCSLTIDQQAQRIGELEGLLMDVAGMFHGPGIEGGPLTKLRRRIAATLSAGNGSAK